MPSEFTMSQVIEYLRRQRDAAEAAGDQVSYNRYQYMLGRVQEAQKMMEQSRPSLYDAVEKLLREWAITEFPDPTTRDLMIHDLAQVLDAFRP